MEEELVRPHETRAAVGGDVRTEEGIVPLVPWAVVHEMGVASRLHQQHYVRLVLLY